MERIPATVRRVLARLSLDSGVEDGNGTGHRLLPGLVKHCSYFVPDWACTTMFFLQLRGRVPRVRLVPLRRSLVTRGPLFQAMEPKKRYRGTCLSRLPGAPSLLQKSHTLSFLPPPKALLSIHLSCLPLFVENGYERGFFINDNTPVSSCPCQTGLASSRRRQFRDLSLSGITATLPFLYTPTLLTPFSVPLLSDHSCLSSKTLTTRVPYEALEATR